jgi:glucose/arabinose dehydrogenase
MKPKTLSSITFCLLLTIQLTALGDAPLLTGQSAMGDWTTDSPGTRRLITVTDLPRPYDTPSSDNGPHVVPRPKSMWPIAPPGFTVDLLATDLTNPRKIITAPNGDLFVAESEPGRIKVLRQKPDGTVASTNVFASNLRQPFGIAFYPPGPNPTYIYIANTDSVVRFPYQNGDLSTRGPSEMIVKDIPGGGRLRGGGHWTRDVVFTFQRQR